MPAGLDVELRRLLRRDQWAEAVRLYEGQTGIPGTLAEDYVRCLGQYPMESPYPDCLFRVMIDTGQSGEAVPLYQELNEVSADVAAGRIEAMREQAAACPTWEPLTVAMIREMRELVAENRKIEAVKRYRSATGVDLREAKRSVEYLHEMADHR